MQLKKTGLLVLLLFCLPILNFRGFAQDQDSLVVLSVEDFFAQIASNHPVAKQSELLPESARQEIRYNRGAFDPLLRTKYANKSFKGNNYFDLWDSYLTIPTWFGTDLKVGYEKNSGPNINPEDYTPPGGLSYVGFTIPIGQGLIIDERRATLRQALLLKDLAEAERIKVINKLLLQASKDYGDWMYYYKKLQLQKEGYELSRFRLQAVKERIRQGDLSAIDSIEASTQMQNFEVMLQQSDLEYKNASLSISSYLWKEGHIPIEISAEVVPSVLNRQVEIIKRDSVEHLVQLALKNHPDILKLSAKLSQLDIEKTFLRDKFKPKFNLEYNLLQPYFFTDHNLGNYDVANNYKIGVSFSQPLFLRRERGKVQLNKVKVFDTNYTLAQTNREITIGINSAYNEWMALESQIKSQNLIVENNQILRNAELKLFENGESSLFIINQRELALINSQIKLYEMLAKYFKSRYFIQWAAGVVHIAY